MPKILGYLFVKISFTSKNYQVKTTLWKYASEYVTPGFDYQGREMDKWVKFHAISTYCLRFTVKGVYGTFMLVCINILLNITTLLCIISHIVGTYMV